MKLKWSIQKISIQGKTSTWNTKARPRALLSWTCPISDLDIDLTYFYLFLVFMPGPSLRYTYFSLNDLKCKECRFLPKIFIRDNFFQVSIIFTESHSKHKMQIKASVYVYAFYFGQIWVGRYISIFHIPIFLYNDAI